MRRDRETAVPGHPWEWGFVHLGAVAGEDVLVRLHFDTVDEIANSYDGWFIDDLRVDDQAGS